MFSGDVIELIDQINLIIGFIDKAILEGESIANFTIEDEDTSVAFGIKKLNEITTLSSIEKVSEDTLRDIYLSLVDYYKDNIGIGATMEYKEKNIQWNIAPVIADKVLVEFISPRVEDQKWFYDEIVASCAKNEKRLG